MLSGRLLDSWVQASRLMHPKPSTRVLMREHLEDLRNLQDLETTFVGRRYGAGS